MFSGWKHSGLVERPVPVSTWPLCPMDAREELPVIGVSAVQQEVLSGWQKMRRGLNFVERVWNKGRIWPGQEARMAVILYPFK